MRAYFQSNRAHNTLEVDGKDFSRQKKDAYGSAIQSVERVGEYWLVSAAAHHKALGVIHQRVLFYKPGVGVDVLDRVLNLKDKSRTYRFHWHLGEYASVDSSVDNDGKLGTLSTVFVQGELDTQLSVKNSLNLAAELNVHKGQEETRLHGWISREYLKFEPSSVLEVRFDVQDAEFLTLSSWRLASAVAEPCPVKLSGRRIIADEASLQQRIHDLFASVAP